MNCLVSVIGVRRSPVLRVPEAGDHLPTRCEWLAQVAVVPAPAARWLGQPHANDAVNEAYFQTQSLKLTTFYESLRFFCLYRFTAFSTVGRRKQNNFWIFPWYIFATTQGAQSLGSVTNLGILGTVSCLPGLLSAVFILGSSVSPCPIYFYSK